MSETSYTGDIVKVVDNGEKLMVYMLSHGNPKLIAQLETQVASAYDDFDRVVDVSYPYYNMASSIYEEILQACDHLGYGYKK